MSRKLIESNDNYKVYLNEETGVKYFISPEANYTFDSKSGMMCMWGKTFKDSPTVFPAPNILDIEITDICSGIGYGENRRVCPFCYKSNLPTNDSNMSFETFKKIFDILPKSLTQIAFGADATLTSNPDLWKMMEYCRENGVVPNITAAQIDDETADKLVQYCGAVAISKYHDKDICYDSIKRLTDRGLHQVNMHFMISEETYDRALETLEDIKTDERLSKLNAIVFLSLKQKGRGVGYHPLSQEKFDNLLKIAVSNKIGVGFDSCSSYKAMLAFNNPEILEILGTESAEGIKSCIIPCESTLESNYINVKGFWYPCSFCEGENDWKEGINVLECTSTSDFLNKVWINKKTEEFRKSLLNTACNNSEHCRTCPYYNV